MNVKAKAGTAVHDTDIHNTMRNWRKHRVILRCGLQVEVIGDDAVSSNWRYTSEFVTCFNCLRIINKDSILKEVKIMTGRTKG